MDKQFTPLLNCGSCPVALAWDGLTDGDRAAAHNTHCAQCDYYKEISQIPPEDRCVCCGRYAPNGYVCWSCENEAH